MKEFRKRRSKQDEIIFFALRCAAAAILLIITLFLMHAAWGMYSKMTASSAAQDDAEAELHSVELQRQGVTTTLSESTSERGVEQQIRERYGVVRPGEGEIDVIRTKPATSTPEITTESWWRRLFRALFVW